MRILCAVLTVFFVFQPLVFPAESQAAINAALDEANRSFTFQNKPIHPGLVQEFSSWISDSGFPTTISVDIAAPHGNEYFEDDVTVREGKYVCADTKGEDHEKDGGLFCYEWLGRLDNGLHVLSVSEAGGGSGVFEDLFFVRFDKGEGYTHDGKKYDRLLMSIVREFILGDRDDGKIKVLKNSVVVGKSRYRDKDVTLTFQ